MSCRRSDRTTPTLVQLLLKGYDESFSRGGIVLPRFVLIHLLREVASEAVSITTVENCILGFNSSTARYFKG